jgi:hypothetical protein
LFIAVSVQPINSVSHTFVLSAFCAPPRSAYSCWRTDPTVNYGSEHDGESCMSIDIVIVTTTTTTTTTTTITTTTTTAAAE